MSSIPWRQIAIPHDDVLGGLGIQAGFAADLSRVQQGKGVEEYQNPAIFFQRTYITDGMRELLGLVLNRVHGRDGDPMVQLQTGFGGGKTHTLLAIYHLLTAENAAQIPEVQDLMQGCKIDAIPTTKVVVFNGINLGPSQLSVTGDIKINTLCGELAYRLAGVEGYEMVKKADIDGTSPGKEKLIELLSRFSPCVILLDELQAYMRQLHDVKDGSPGGTLSANLTFVQALTEAVSEVPTSMLMVALPQTENEAGGAHGQQVLGSLTAIFQRVRKIWQHMSADEAYQVVIRRLFKPIEEKNKRDRVCRQIASWYRDNAEYFPSEVIEGQYVDKLKQCYPFHPQLFHQLYVEWGALPNFQQTRGMLKLLAPVIQHLWNREYRTDLIMAGDMPLNDNACRSGFISDMLDPGWDSVIDHDIDGNENTVSHRLDNENRDTFGRYNASRRMARSIFIGSAPSFRDSSSSQRGISSSNALLSGVSPNESPRMYQDALKKLTDTCHYLNAHDGRFWFDVHANLQRQMEDIKQHLEYEVVFDITKKRMQELLKGANVSVNGLFESVHIFTPNADIPDDMLLRLIVMPPDAAYSPTGQNHAQEEIIKALSMRGEHARANKNNMLFLAASYESVGNLKDAARQLLAWKEINDKGELTDNTQIRQVRKKIETSETGLNASIANAYNWLLVPTKNPDNADDDNYELSPANVGTERIKYIDNILHCCKHNEWVIEQWSDELLNSMVLRRYYWNEDLIDVPLSKLWADMRQFCFMPRLKNREVLVDAIRAGVERKKFAVALNGKVGGEDYGGFVYGATLPMIQSPNTTLIIPSETAEEVDAVRRQQKSKSDADGDSVSESPEGEVRGGDGAVVGGGNTGQQSGQQSESTRVNKRFFGAIELSPNNVVAKATEIHEEILSQLVQDPNSKVVLTLEISAENESGFGLDKERTVKENAGVLQFKSAEFTEE